MKIANLTKNEILEIIDRVVLNHSNKEFDGFLREDIIQECWVMSLKQLNKFDIKKTKNGDPKKALEHWLNKVLSNRLKNFYRDKHTVPKKNFNCVSIDNNEILNFLSIGSVNDILYSELFKCILLQLNEETLYILESIMSGEIINSYYKNKIIKLIKKIVEEYHGQ